MYVSHAALMNVLKSNDCNCVFQLANKILDALRIAAERHKKQQTTLREADSTSKDPAHTTSTHEPSSSKEGEGPSSSTQGDVPASSQQPVQQQGFDPKTGMVIKSNNKFIES